MVHDGIVATGLRASKQYTTVNKCFRGRNPTYSRRPWAGHRPPPAKNALPLGTLRPLGPS